MPDNRRARDALTRRQKDFQMTFGSGEFAEAVLADLARFCRASETTFHADPRIHAVLEGRREVWLRIRDHLDMDDETLWQKYGANT